mmetsp:Transcript_4163/g.11283  ORF Transcript_4163/g.11283 Transcript_4163/m.11283 type:complete len:274 (-) Transcript_4163:1248-2069(-)
MVAHRERAAHAGRYAPGAPRVPVGCVFHHHRFANHVFPVSQLHRAVRAHRRRRRRLLRVLRQVDVRQGEASPGRHGHRGWSARVLGGDVGDVPHVDDHSVGVSGFYVDAHRAHPRLLRVHGHDDHLRLHLQHHHLRGVRRVPARAHAKRVVFALLPRLFRLVRAQKGGEVRLRPGGRRQARVRRRLRARAVLPREALPAAAHRAMGSHRRISRARRRGAASGVQADHPAGQRRAAARRGSPHGAVRHDQEEGVHGLQGCRAVGQRQLGLDPLR